MANVNGADDTFVGAGAAAGAVVVPPNPNEDDVVCVEAVAPKLKAGAVADVGACAPRPNDGAVDDAAAGVAPRPNDGAVDDAAAGVAPRPNDGVVDDAAAGVAPKTNDGAVDAEGAAGGAVPKLNEAVSALVLVDVDVALEAPGVGVGAAVEVPPKLNVAGAATEAAGAEGATPNDGTVALGSAAGNPRVAAVDNVLAVDEDPPKPFGAGPPRLDVGVDS